MIMDLMAVRGIASEIARSAGAALMQTFDQPHQQRTKRSYNDIVTEGDKASEAIIVAGLTQHFPDHHIITEESGSLGAPAETAEYFWHIDPLDGTSNYASNIPLFCVSMGMADKNMNPLVSAIYDPFSDELYSASLGGGTTLNDRTVHVSTTDQLSQAMLCTGFPYDSTNLTNSNFGEWAIMHAHARGLRRFGSVATELAYIAAGRLDGLWEQRLNAWDIMAGILLVREAGGRVTDYRGEENQRLYQGVEIIATNSNIHQQLMDTLGDIWKNKETSHTSK